MARNALGTIVDPRAGVHSLAPTDREARPASAAAKSSRVVAIDALRGFDMFWIMGGHGLLLALAAWMSSTGQPPDWLATQMSHQHWVGFHAWDLINPMFLFISGASMAFSFEPHLNSGAQRGSIYRRMATRFALLWILGMMVQGNLLEFRRAEFRPFTNVLQTIACGYVVTGLMLLHVPRRFHYLVTAALLVVYWLLMRFVPVPGLGTGVLEEDRNLAAWIDVSILGSHAYKHTVSEGVYTVHYGYFLPILNFAAIMMLGLYAGQWLRSARAPVEKFFGLVCAGIACLVGGWLWSFSFPIIKPLFTSSMVLWASGLSLLLLAAFFGLTDVLKWRSWAYPCVVIGANSLFAYVVPHLFDEQIRGISGKLFDGLARHVEPWALHPVVWSAGYVLAIWLMLWLLYRNRLFWRV